MCADPLPETMLAARAPAPPAVEEVAAGWYPDGAGSLRWWDGQVWTDHVSPAETAPVPAAVAPAWTEQAWSEPAAPSVPAWSADPWSGPYGADPYGSPTGYGTSGGHGRFLGAIPRTVGRKGRFDLLVYEHSLVLAKVAGTDPATIGAMVGFLVGGGSVLGYIVGDYVGASGNDRRVAELAARAPEELSTAHAQNRLVPRAALRSAEVVTHGRSGGRLELQLHDGTRVRRRWTRPHTRGSQPAAILAQALHGLATVKKSPPWRLLVVVSIVVAMSLAVVLAVLFGGRSDPGFDAARAEVATACAPYVALNDRVESGEGTTIEEISAIVDPMVEPFSRAALRHADFAPASQAVAALSQALHGEVTDEVVPTLDAYGSTVYTACTW